MLPYTNKTTRFLATIKLNTFTESIFTSKFPSATMPHVSKFSWQGLKKTWEVFPLIAVVCGATVGLAGVTYWMFNTRDIQFNKRRKPINERMDLLEPTPLKLRVIKHYPQPVPELHSIYQAMGEEQDRRQRELEGQRKSKRKTKSGVCTS